jgi:hypothetical protein
VVTQLLHEALVTMTILRDPVDRALAQLKRAVEEIPRFKGRSLADVYDDERYVAAEVRNFQTKLFAMTIEDPLRSCMDVIDIDEQRLETARANLARIDVLGLSEDYPEFCQRVRARYGWIPGPAATVEVGDERDGVAPSLVERVQRDNWADIELYRYAKSLMDAEGNSLEHSGVTS